MLWENEPIKNDWEWQDEGTRLLLESAQEKPHLEGDILPNI